MSAGEALERRYFMMTTRTVRQIASRPRVRLLAATVAGFVLAGAGALASQAAPGLSGFTTDLSVNRGQTVRFKIETDALAYSITIYQLGGSEVAEATPVASLPAPPAPQLQPPCLPNQDTGLVDCSNWSDSASWTVPAGAVAGIYVALLQRPDTNGSSQIVFVVQDEEEN